MNTVVHVHHSDGKSTDTVPDAVLNDLEKRFDRSHIMTMEQAVTTIKALLDSINFDSGIDRLKIGRAHV